MPLSMDQRQQLLAEPYVAALSVSAGAGRGPLTVPIWYYFVPGDLPWVLSPPDSRKSRLIAAAGRFTLLVQRTSPSVRYVSLAGEVAGTGPATDEQVRLMARRYLPAEAVDDYVAFARHEHIIRMRPVHWLSADLGPA